MKQAIAICILVVGIVAGSVSTARAQRQQGQGVEYELVLEGIEKKPVVVELINWSWGASATELDPTLSPRKELHVNDVSFVIAQSPTSVVLLETLFAKKVLPRAIVRVKQPHDHAFELVLRNVRITSYSTGGTSGRSYNGDTPLEQVSLTFQTGKMTVKTTAGSHSAELKN